jgi:hypothetical protein
MEPIKIVRIERNGKGVFRPSNRIVMKSPIAKRTYNRHNAMSEEGGFPMPHRDNIDTDLGDKEWFFSYNTIEQLQSWILKDELNYFISMGFKIYLLEVSEYQKGGNQVAFTIDGIITKEDITALFE